MPVRWLARTGSFAVAAAAVAAGLLGASHLNSVDATHGVEIVGALVAIAAVYLACTAKPAYLFTLAIMLTPFASNWQQLGVPGPLAPDRLLFVVGTAVVLFRCYVIGDLPRPRFAVSHTVMALALLFAAVSAMVSHVLLQKGPGLLLVETFGILPFVSFWLAPVIFPTARERRILLVALVVMGAYLGLTALFETTGLKALVWPRYILNPSVGIHYGRARGPFVDAVANGVGLYVGAVASVIAAYQWRRRGLRVLAISIGALDLAGTIMTLERSIWISTGVATLVALLAFRKTRRIAIPAVLAVSAVAAIAVFAIPGLQANVTGRLHNSDSIYDRENTTVTALNMIRARPLLGFGWDQYQAAHDPYVQQSANIPLTATSIDLHNAYLTYAVELGLIGGTLWLLAVILGAGGTALTRAPPDLEPWRAGLVALLVFFLIGESSVPPTVFVNASLWLWAGVVALARYPPREPALAEPLTGSIRWLPRSRLGKIGFAGSMLGGTAVASAVALVIPLGRSGSPARAVPERYASLSTPRTEGGHVAERGTTRAARREPARQPVRRPAGASRTSTSASVIAAPAPAAAPAPQSGTTVEAPLRSAPTGNGAPVPHTPGGPPPPAVSVVGTASSLPSAPASLGVGNNTHWSK